MAGIHRLPNDLLKEILDHLDSEPQRPIAIDRRDHLSVESFRAPTPPLPREAHDIGNFRLTCQRFSELGIPYQFSRISLRFSDPGFRRLDKICSHKHLTQHTRKFTYLVPPFYGSALWRVANGDNATRSFELSPRHSANVRKKAAEQRTILDSGQDVRILRKAMGAFTSLQHVQILRLIEPLEIEVPRPFLNLEWSPACTHATKTIGEALLAAASPFNSFSGSMINPQSVLVIQEEIPSTLTSLASRLTCLELHFDGGPEMMTSLVELSDLARTVFLAATNLQALHVGFPARAPLDLRLKDMLRNIAWKNLRAFGVQAWRIHADEVIDVVRRHKKTLRGLRLRDVQLKNGSRWKDVLSVLHGEMEQLEWVSLRRIDYASHFDAVWGGRMEVGDDLPAIDSDSEEEEPEPPDHFSGGESDTSDDGSDEDSDEEIEHGTYLDEFNFLPDTPVSLPFCTCVESSWPSADDLGDDGKSVTPQQSRMWERWVCGKCPEHA